MVETKTVGPSGCDYTATGTNDQVQINYALAYAKDHPWTTVWIKGPFTYDIQDTLLVGSYTTVKMDSDVKLRLHDSAAWAANKAIVSQLDITMANVEIYGGEVDGNYVGNSGAVISEQFESVSGWVTSNSTVAEGGGFAKITATAANYNISKTVAYNLSTSTTIHISARASLNSSVYVTLSSDNGANWNKYIFNATTVNTPFSITIAQPNELSGTLDLANVSKITIGNAAGNIGDFLYVDYISIGAATLLPLNSGYYPFFVFYQITNLNIHDMTLHDGAGHGLKVTTGTNVIFHSNTIKNLGGDAFFVDASTTVDAFSNNITIRGNSGIHIKNTSNSLIHNNYLLGVDDTNGGVAAVLIEDTDGRTDYPDIYENVILDAYGAGILIQENDTGNSNRHKHCHVHHNTVRRCGKSTIHDFVGGCTIRGFNGTIIEDNSFDGCYHAGILSRYDPLSDGDSITCRRNTISNTKKHNNSNYRYGWSGRGIANSTPNRYSMYLENNIVYNNEGGDYFGADGRNDVETTPTFQSYVPPTTYIQDEVDDYYVTENGIPRTAYINRYPFRWQAKKIDMAKSIGQEKPPGMDGWALEDFGFGGANITLTCYAYSLQEMRNVIAAFYQAGKSTLELGGIYVGWKISGVCANHSTDITLTKDVPERAYPFEILFLADKAIMESTTKKIRTKKVTDDQQTWDSDDCYPGNCIKNHNFHTWTQGSVITSWHTQASAANNSLTSVCWAPASSPTSTITVGQQPFGIVLNSDQTKAYVANWYNNRVSVITFPNTVNTISTNMGDSPYGICILPNNSKVYVPCYGDNCVKIITTSNNQVSGTITNNIGTSPVMVACTPNGSKVYVTNYGSSNISVIDTNTDTATKFTIGTNPSNIAINPSGTKAYCTIEGSDCVKVFQVSDNLILKTINVGDKPNGIAINPSGTRAYVSNSGANTVSVIDLSSDTVIGTPIPVGTEPDGISVSPDGSKVYVCNKGTTTVSVINTTSNTVSSTLSGFSRPGDCVATADALYVTNYGTSLSSNTVTKVVISSTGKFVSVASSGTDNRVQLSTDGGATWSCPTLSNANKNNDWQDIAYESSIPLYVAVANSGTNRIMTSSDATDNTWTARTPAVDNNWRAVAYGGATSYKKWVVVGDSGTNRTMYAANATSTWTSVAANPSTQNWVDVVWAAGSINLWVAVSYTGTTQQIMTAPGNATGLTWTARTTPLTQAYTAIAYSPALGMLACCAETGSSTQQIMTSTNPTATNGWELQITPEAHPWTDICWDDVDGVFICVASDGAIMASDDGKKWVMQTSGTTNALQAVCYSSALKKFCAVASSGSGNRVLTCSDLSYNTLFDTAPTDWVFRGMGQRQSDHCYSGINSYLIRGDGANQRRGYSAQPFSVEPGMRYMLSGRGKTSGLTQGRMRAGIYSGDTELYGIEWDSDDSEWTDYEEYCTFDDDETDLELRLYSDDYADDDSYMYCDQVFVVRAKHYETAEIGNNITTTGTVDVVPDVMITATRLTSGTITEGFYVPKIDNGLHDVNGNLYGDPLYTHTLLGKPNKRHRIDKVRARHCSDSDSYDAYTKVTYQWGTGSENQLCEFRGNRIYPDFEDMSYSPYLIGNENESCTIRYYGKSEHSSHSSHHKDLGVDSTEIITNKLGTGIQIYNTIDPLTIMHVCNKLDPGATMEINHDGTGSFRYVENLTDITYQTACYSKAGDSFNQNTRLLTLATAGSVIYRFDTRYPITGRPYIVLDVFSGNPQILIAAESTGNPGTYYSVTGNDVSATNHGGERLYRELVQTENLSLKGSTVFYVKITPYTSQTCVINSLFVYADLVTIDAERPKIYATGKQNTFKVNMPNNTALEVSLQFRDAHRII